MQLLCCRQEAVFWGTNADSSEAAAGSIKAVCMLCNVLIHLGHAGRAVDEVITDSNKYMPDAWYEF